MYRKMPSGSPTSDKYVVYSIDSDDGQSVLSDGDDACTALKDPDYIELREKASDSPSKPTFSSSPSIETVTTSIKWGSSGRWSGTKRCCCLWNVVLVSLVLSLGVLVFLIYKDIINLHDASKHVIAAGELESPKSSSTSGNFPSTTDLVHSTVPTNKVGNYCIMYILVYLTS
jgi:hypothetical protein